MQWSKAQLDAVSDSLADLITEANVGATVALATSQTADTDRVNLLVPAGALIQAQQSIVDLATSKFAGQVVRAEALPRHPCCRRPCTRPAR